MEYGSSNSWPIESQDHQPTGQATAGADRGLVDSPNSYDAPRAFRLISGHADRLTACRGSEQRESESERSEPSARA
jgi:hypothetical protein